MIAILLPRPAREEDRTFWRRLFRREAPDANAPLLDIPHVVEEGETSPDAARQALDLLTREDERVQRRIKAILSSHGAMTPGKVRRARCAGPSAPAPARRG